MLSSTRRLIIHADDVGYIAIMDGKMIKDCDALARSIGECDFCDMCIHLRDAGLIDDRVFAGYIIELGEEIGV